MLENFADIWKRTATITATLPQPIRCCAMSNGPFVDEVLAPTGFESALCRKADGKSALVEGSSSLSSTFGLPFFTEQSQAGAHHFCHGSDNRTQNLVGDDFFGLCRQAAF